MNEEQWAQYCYMSMRIAKRRPWPRELPSLTRREAQWVEYWTRTKDAADALHVYTWIEAQIPYCYSDEQRKAIWEARTVTIDDDDRRVITIRMDMPEWNAAE